MSDNYFVVDRIENTYAVMEVSNTKEIINVKLDKLPKNIKDGDILIIKDDVYIKNDELKIKRLQEIKEKFEKLRGE